MCFIYKCERSVKTKRNANVCKLKELARILTTHLLKKINSSDGGILTDVSNFKI